MNIPHILPSVKRMNDLISSKPKINPPNGLNTFMILFFIITMQRYEKKII